MEYKEAAQALEALATECELWVDSTLIPFSRSRNAHEKTPSVNWEIRLFKGPKPGLVAPGDTRTLSGQHLVPIWSGPYTQGIAHLETPRKFDPRCVDGDNAIRQACETGKGIYASHYIRPDVKAVRPTLADILHSLLLDASAIDEASFEDWASSLGYDIDSRKAESTYRECLKIGLALRAAIGNEKLSAMRDLAQEM